LLFSDIVTSKLFRENVTYRKTGTTSYESKRDGKTIDSSPSTVKEDNFRQFSRDYRAMGKAGF
jgi:stalled ribosome alternative rescue factor ArfA